MKEIKERRCPKCGMEVLEEDGELVDLEGVLHTENGVPCCGPVPFWSNVT